MSFCISRVIYDDRPGNKKTYQYELIRLQPINLVFAQNSTFCACVDGLGGIENMPTNSENIFFVNSLCINKPDNRRISYKSCLVFFATLIHMFSPPPI